MTYEKRGSDALTLSAVRRLRCEKAILVKNVPARKRYEATKEPCISLRVSGIEKRIAPKRI